MALDLARWQFGLTTVFHFFFVPVTIGLSMLVAVMQTLAYRRQDETWDRLTRFFGRLFLINLAIGVVTGIVLEFQFGMNWSAYSVFVGNIFGAPLAIEGLLAPVLWVTYWSFRIMIGMGILLLLISAWGVWSARNPKFAHTRWFAGIALTGIALPLIANTSGWIFTEMGRQPWVVYGVMKTLRGVSPTVPFGEVLTTLIGFTAIYTVLGAVDAALMIRAAHRDLDAPQQPGEQQAPSLVY
ncbi:MAG: cytochrome ubiquinol oxidase subunit I [Gemmatimonadota bacterium]